MFIWHKYYIIIQVFFTYTRGENHAGGGGGPIKQLTMTARVELNFCDVSLNLGYISPRSIKNVANTFDQYIFQL